MAAGRPSPLEVAWSPTPEIVQRSNLQWLMQRAGVATYEELHAWSVRERADFWRLAIERLGVVFRRPYERVLDDREGPEHARWLVGAELNVADSCFAAAPESPAILHQHEGGDLRTMTVGELDGLSNQVAHALRQRGIAAGDAVGLLLPMTAESVAAYLGIVKAGAIAVGIADSFGPAEIGVRLRIGQARLVITQDVILRAGRRLELYTRLQACDAPPAIVLPAQGQLLVDLRPHDVAWADFLSPETGACTATRLPDDVLNVLFSSGTTGEPKAIPWTHLCAIKGAMDAHFHHDVHPGDVLAWPTSLGWMMGPWLIFASLMNRAALALYVGTPTDHEFGQFVERAGVTLLGVVPSLVAAWRASGSLQGTDWHRINAFSSTGECSNPDDMRWLMEHAGGRPVIEYCGGTEIAGGYITGVVVRPCIPATFNTPALGLEVVILDDQGRPADKGELFVVPPSIGLSNRLLNKDHHEVYYAGCPQGPRGEILRRHGDEMERLPSGYWRAHGRADDTMNLGGIKVSSAEIERTVNLVEGVLETAAVAESPPGGGPSHLVIFCVMKSERPAPQVHQEMQAALRRELNPLFRIDRVQFVPALPRTASNKVMRRMLRSPTGA